MHTEVNSSLLENKLLYGNLAEEGKHKYMASLQLNGKHICSSSMFQVGLLLTTGFCACEIGEGIQLKHEKATAVLSASNLKIGQRIDILKLGYYSSYYYYQFDIGIIKVGRHYITCNFLFLNS